jgi:hypothetical protein
MHILKSIAVHIVTTALAKKKLSNIPQHLQVRHYSMTKINPDDTENTEHHPPSSQ